MTDEEIEKQAIQYAEENVCSNYSVNNFCAEEDCKTCIVKRSFQDGAKWGMERLREDFQQGKITCAGMTIQEIMNLKKENEQLKKQWRDCFLSCSSPYCAGHFPAVKMEGELGNMAKK